MAEKNTYEAMWLVDAGQGNTETAAEPIRTILERYDVDILALKPWEERRLAYEIKGRKRALYILSYLKADPEHLGEIEHDANLNEGILRMLILRKDGLSEEEIAADTPASGRSGRDEKDEATGGKGDRSEKPKGESRESKTEAKTSETSEKSAEKPEARASDSSETDAGSEAPQSKEDTED